jgi:YidC/Oxa1 family membrane protein insertase
MERRTLIAVVLIMIVLFADSLFMSRWYGRKGTGPGGRPAATAPDSAGHGPAGTTPEALAPAVPPGGGPSQAASGSSGLEGAVAPRVNRAPLLEREIVGQGFRATLTSRGGAISHWTLEGYRDPVRKLPVVDLLAAGGCALPVVLQAGSATFDFSDVPFELRAEDAAGRVTFAAVDSATQVRVEKTYALSSDRRVLELTLKLWAPPALGPIRYQFGWGEALPRTEVYAKPQEIHPVAYLGEKLVNVTGPQLAKAGERREHGNLRWAGQRSKYFLAAVIPDSATFEDVVFRQTPSRDAAAWIVGAAAPGTEVTRHARVYGGPIHYDALLVVGSGLQEVANLGWKWMVPLSLLMLKLLNLLHGVIPNYGIGIILLAAGTKLVFYPLTQSSLRSMKVMHRLQPEVNAIRERHHDDPAKMNQAMMALYKTNKVNPLGGCLPMLLQVPVFIALYNVLLFSIELRASGFVGYIQDLASPDVLATVAGFPIHLMPLIMTGSTYLLQSQTPVDPRQQAMMYIMPTMMLIFMYTFPSGVILYWTVNNLISALQQYLVNLAEDRRVAAGA